MNKEKALHQFFAANPAFVQLLILHRDGYTCAEKAKKRCSCARTVKNQQGMVIKIFEVNEMDEAVHHAMYYEIIAPKRNRKQPAPRRTLITPQWSEELQNYHEKYLLNLPESERREVGCEW